MITENLQCSGQKHDCRERLDCERVFRRIRPYAMGISKKSAQSKCIFSRGPAPRHCGLMKIQTYAIVGLYGRTPAPGWALARTRLRVWQHSDHESQT